MDAENFYGLHIRGCMQKSNVKFLMLFYLFILHFSQEVCLGKAQENKQTRSSTQ